MLEDLFSVVRTRFNGEGKADEVKKAKLIFQRDCCSNVPDVPALPLSKIFRITERSALVVIIMPVFPQGNGLI